MLKKPLFVAIVLLLVLFVVADKVFYPTPERFILADGASPLIASGGGSIDGYTGTNSREAVLRAIEDGASIIALDFFIASDGQAVAVRDMDSFAAMSGYTGSHDAMKAHDIAQLPLHGRYHAVLGTELNTLFAKETTYLLAGGSLPPRLAAKTLELAHDRLLLEVHSYAEYTAALREGIRYPVLRMQGEGKLERHHYHLLLGKIKLISIEADKLQADPARMQELHERGVTLFVHTKSDAALVERYQDIVSGWYVDAVKKP